MKYIVFISAAVFIANMLDDSRAFLDLLRFNPSLIVQFQIWRVITWIFLPLNNNIFFTLIMLYFYYFIGGSLEREWGTAKFTVYYILGVLLNIVYGLVVWFILGRSANNIGIVPNFLNMSLLFAFAAVFPDFQIRLFFIIPFKIKWLAILNGVFFAYWIIVDLFNARYVMALLPIIALLNFIIVCGNDVVRPVKARARSSAQAINFKKAARRAQRNDSRPYRHKCAVCGKTDTDNPGLEFRYCSRCNGYHCFCIDHINNHVHFK